MAWTHDQIRDDWLAGSQIAVEPAILVEAFERVEAILGRPWIEQSRTFQGGSGPARGAHPTLVVAKMGARLAAPDIISRGRDDLVEALKGGAASALAELNAIYLIHSQEPQIDVQMYPPLANGRVPDFCVRRRCENDWTYIEVTQPDTSEAQLLATGIIDKVASVVQSVKKSFALEVFLRRQPTSDELEKLLERMSAFCEEGGSSPQLELPGNLGLLTLNNSAPGMVVLVEHPREPAVPRVGAVRVIGGGDEPHRHISVRMAFADDRAELFFHREARQLPSDAPGLLMIGMSRAPGGFKEWQPLIQRRFQPSIHTRVSGVCLFGGGSVLTPAGEAFLDETKLLLNRHARCPLHAWLAAALEQAGAAFDRAMKPAGGTSLPDS